MGPKAQGQTTSTRAPQRTYSQRRQVLRARVGWSRSSAPAASRVIGSHTTPSFQRKAHSPAWRPSLCEPAGQGLRDGTRAILTTGNTPGCRHDNAGSAATAKQRLHRRLSRARRVRSSPCRRPSRLRCWSALINIIIANHALINIILLLMRSPCRCPLRPGCRRHPRLCHPLGPRPSAPRAAAVGVTTPRLCTAPPARP
jgi:hypothetical protein